MRSSRIRRSLSLSCRIPSSAVPQPPFSLGKNPLPSVPAAQIDLCSQICFSSKISGAFRENRPAISEDFHLPPPHSMERDGIHRPLPPVGSFLLPPETFAHPIQRGARLLFGRPVPDRLPRVRRSTPLHFPPKQLFGPAFSPLCHFPGPPSVIASPSPFYHPLVPLASSRRLLPCLRKEGPHGGAPAPPGPGRPSSAPVKPRVPRQPPSGTPRRSG